MDLRERREAIVREHMESENRHEFDVTLGTFDHPRYEIVPTGEVFDGPEQVGEYFEITRTAFPDQRNELIELTHLDAQRVLIEFWLRGTPTTSGKPFERRLWAVFDFDDHDLMTNERVFLNRPDMRRP